MRRVKIDDLNYPPATRHDVRMLCWRLASRVKLNSLQVECFVAVAQSFAEAKDISMAEHVFAQAWIAARSELSLKEWLLEECKASGSSILEVHRAKISVQLSNKRRPKRADNAFGRCLPMNNLTKVTVEPSLYKKLGKPGVLRFLGQMYRLKECIVLDSVDYVTFIVRTDLAHIKSILKYLKPWEIDHQYAVDEVATIYMRKCRWGDAFRVLDLVDNPDFKVWSLMHTLLGTKLGEFNKPEIQRYLKRRIGLDFSDQK